jgi:hypothetical protein
VPTPRSIFPALAATAALLLLPNTATAAPSYADQVKGIEYSATSTVGKFSGTATGPLPGAWNAVVIHNQLQSGAVPITGGLGHPLQPPRSHRQFRRGHGVPAQHPDRLYERTLQRHR